MLRLPLLFVLVFIAPRANATTSAPHKFKETSEKFGVYLPRIGRAFLPNVSVESKLWFGTKLIYRAHYSSDQYGRRIVPLEGRKSRKRFVLFSGCSNTWGEGLNDEETIPANIARLAPDLMPYNYAFQGWGPHELLAILQTRNVRKEIQEKDGILIYHYHYYHQQRVMGSADFFSWSKGKAPYFYFGRDGKLKNEQTFSEAMPRRVKWMPQVLHYTRKVLPEMDWTARPFWEDPDKLVCQIFKEAREEFKKQFPTSKFLIVINPNPVKPKSDNADNLIRDCFVPFGISFLDLRKENARFSINEVTRLPYDGHYNAIGAERISQLILPEIMDHLENP